MPTFRYDGDPGRYYPGLGITPTPGETCDLDSDPGDGRWQAASKSPATPAKPEPTEPADAGSEE